MFYKPGQETTTKIKGLLLVQLATHEIFYKI